MRTNTVSCFVNAWIASRRTTCGSRSVWDKSIAFIFMGFRVPLESNPIAPGGTCLRGNRRRSTLSAHAFVPGLNQIGKSAGLAACVETRAEILMNLQQPLLGAQRARQLPGQHEPGLHEPRFRIGRFRRQHNKKPVEKLLHLAGTRTARR